MNAGDPGSTPGGGIIFSIPVEFYIPVEWSISHLISIVAVLSLTGTIEPSGLLTLPTLIDIVGGVRFCTI